MNPQSHLQESLIETLVNENITYSETHPEPDFCVLTPDSVPIPDVPEESAERTSTETPIDSQSCECARPGCQKCDLLCDTNTRKLQLKKKMPFPMSAFIVSGIGMFLLCTVLSVTIATEAETGVEETPKGLGHHGHHGHNNPSLISVDHYSTGHHDVTKLKIQPFKKKILVTKNHIFFPIISYELLQKIKHLLLLPLEFIQWLIPPIIYLKQFLVTLTLFLIKLLDVRNDFKDNFHFDENELDEGWSREL